MLRNRVPYYFQYGMVLWVSSPRNNGLPPSFKELRVFKVGKMDQRSLDSFI